MKTYSDTDKIATLRELTDECVKQADKGIFSNKEMRLAKTVLTMLLGRKPTESELNQYCN